MRSRKELTDSLIHYSTPYPVEEKFKSQFLQLLEQPNAYHRDHLPGHMTGSAWVIDEKEQRALLTHHAKLNRWLQPGGHADGDEDIFNVALREVEEETGLRNITLIGTSFFDIDIHIIPARKDFPEHLHYDVRFLFRASSKEKLSITRESHALAWKKITDLPSLVQGNESILRMAEKVEKLF
jgi:8-oxo-dGTP pyrophosphatase MutT (NUDIX family)